MKVKYTQTHLNLAHEREAAFDRLKHVRYCFVTMQEMLDQPSRLPDDCDVVVLALWHDAVNTAVGVYELIKWQDDTIRGSIGIDEDTFQILARKHGWSTNPDFDEWRGLRHHQAHVLRRETVSFPFRRTLPVVNPPRERKDLSKIYIDDYNFHDLPGDEAIKRFDQFSHGLAKAVNDWYDREVAEADEEARHWFHRKRVDERKSNPPPPRLVESNTDTPREIIEKLLVDLTDEIRWGFATSRRVAQVRYEIRKEIKYALQGIRFKVDRLNADLNSEEAALVQWARDINTRVDALNTWMKDAGGGSPSEMMTYEADLTRYHDILDGLRAGRPVRS